MSCGNPRGKFGLKNFFRTSDLSHQRCNMSLRTKAQDGLISGSAWVCVKTNISCNSNTFQRSAARMALSIVAASNGPSLPGQKDPVGCFLEREKKHDLYIFTPSPRKKNQTIFHAVIKFSGVCFSKYTPPNVDKEVRNQCLWLCGAKLGHSQRSSSKATKKYQSQIG